MARIIVTICSNSIERYDDGYSLACLCNEIDILLLYNAN